MWYRNVGHVNGGDHSRLLTMGFPLVLQVISEVDRGHPALAQLTLDGVPALEGCV